MRDLKGQIIGALFVILTVAAVLCAVVNFDQQAKFKLPDDGIVWSEREENGHSSVEAIYVSLNGPGYKAGIRKGDKLIRIADVRITKAIQVPQVLVAVGAWSRPDYALRRNSVDFQAKVLIAERAPSTAIYFQYLVGGTYLIVGLFVWFRRSSAPKASHFFLLCLASFVLSTFHYTGKLNPFDKIIYWGNVTAGLLVPAMFLDFCLTFPDRVRKGWQRGLIYAIPAVFLFTVAGFAMGFIRTTLPLPEVRWLLDRLWLPLLAAGYLGGAGVLAFRYRRADDSMLRQQLKWLRNGAILGVLPFTLLYVIPYTLDVVPADLAYLAVLSLAFIPLTWAYAVFRYRLMDVDVIFQQGYVYTVAALCVLGVIYGLIFASGKTDDLSPSAIVVLFLIATFVFHPIRNYLQEVLDRHVFYKDRYDYRLTLIEFARELSSETDLDKMIDAVGDRLTQTLSLAHTGFFLADEQTGEFRFYSNKGIRKSNISGQLDLRFLEETPTRNYLFFESPRRENLTLAALDYTYYLPCQVRGRTIAWIGVSRTDKDEFLTSDDLELLVALSGYVGIAIENARLYRSLERKVSEYERLKEFSENIVESINVGILAADLNDRVESWNTRMEDLTGVSREDAVGRPLRSLLPPELTAKLESVRGETGIHHLDKVRLATWTLVPAGNNSREATLNIAVAPLVSRDSQQIGRLIIFDDITDRSELERRLVQADKLSSIGLLAAGVAHEVNTPLAVISSYAQMLAKQVNGDTQKSVMLEKIAKQTFRASEIVNSLLNFSRTAPTDIGDVDLGRVITEVLSLVEHQLQKSGIAVALDSDTHVPPIRGNSGKLQQVFLNLILNARDAMEGEGRLNIRIAADSGSANIIIADTGKGIAPEHLRRIFDPFFTTKGARKGTGLGLSITYGIVEEHGGTIEVDSRLGKGTTFTLTFPLARKPRPELTTVVNA